MAFRVVQPWGPKIAKQSTVLSKHASAEDAFREIDRLAAEMVRTGAPSDPIESRTRPGAPEGQAAEHLLSVLSSAPGMVMRSQSATSRYVWFEVT